jgi:hypothetical protein
MRRDKNDLEWKSVKKLVTLRDKGICRLIKVLTAREGLKLKSIANFNLISRLDHAHIFPVSEYPYLMYDIKNIVLLNRYSHHNLDECKDPITNKLISYESRQNWWLRIIGKETYQYLENKILEHRNNINTEVINDIGLS